MVGFSQPGGSPSSFPLARRKSLIVLAGLLAAAPIPAFAADDGVKPGPGEVYYVDREMVQRASAPSPARNGRYISRWRASRAAGNPIQRTLSEGLNEYRSRWGLLPQIEIGSGPALKPGTSGERVRLLRARLGLWDEGGYDSELQQAVREYQEVHGLPADGVAGARTIESLNLGAGHYERLLRANITRAAALPANLGERYVLVDAAGARLFMYEDGRPVDSMKVVVGKADQQTPMMAGLLRYAAVNPYWNVPVDLVRDRIAPNVLSGGLSYLNDRGYEVLSGWDDDAAPLDPSKVDWEAVAAGREELRVRQKPGPGNMMGDVKFMMPNKLGIYLHDTPDRELFGRDDRRLSSGCVRLEDAQRLGRWLFGHEVRGTSGAREQHIQLDQPVPVYITYFTVFPDETGRIAFRSDVYNRDPALLASMDERLETASR